MGREIAATDFERLWRRLQQLGLNAYEARAYLVLVDHPRFKALELARRANVPRQKIYEVLESLMEKGFANVTQEKTKLFSAIEPGLAVANYLARRRELLERELTDQSRLGSAIVDDLSAAYSDRREGLGTLDYLRIVSEPRQAAAQFREMLAEVSHEYMEFCRPPYATAPLETDLIMEAVRRGISCRILIEAGFLPAVATNSPSALNTLGVRFRLAETLPMKLAVFDGVRGIIALMDPVLTRPAWTSVLFDHSGMGEAMTALFERYWRHGSPLRTRRKKVSRKS